MAEMQFGQQFNEVNINQSFMAKSREAQANRGSTEDWGAVAKEVGNVMNTKDTIDANQAKTDYLTLMTSPEYRDTDATGRTELLENLYKTNPGSKSKAYVDAFVNYSSGQYIVEYDKREEIVDNMYYSSAGAAYNSWLDSDSDVAYEAMDENGKIITKFQSNREAGKKPEDFVNQYQQLRPRLNKAVISTGVLTDLYGEMIFNISLATNKQELEEARLQNQELAQPFKSDKFLDTKSSQGLTLVNSLNTKLAQAETAKLKEFKAAANTRIELNKDTNNPDILKQYKEKPKWEDYVEGQEDKATQKYNDDMHKYNEAEETRQKYFEFDPFEQDDWSAETDRTKKAYQQAVDYAISENIASGSLDNAAGLIYKHGSQDIKRLKNSKEEIKSLLNSEETADNTYQQLIMMQRDNWAAFNVMYPDPAERAKIIALGPLNKVRKEPLSDTWRYIQSAPGFLPEAESLFASKRDELSKLTHSADGAPVALRAEIESMYKAMAAYGTTHEDIMTGIEQYIDSKPYEVNFDQYTSNEKDAMEYMLGHFKSGDNTKFHEDPVNGFLYEEDMYGNRIKLIDKQGLYKYTNDIDAIKNYNSDHVIMQTLEKGAARFSETVSGIVETEFDNAGVLKEALVNTGSYINYLFMTKITKDGKIAPREEWEAPYPLNKESK